MFAQHQPTIADTAIENSDGFHRTCVFVVASIRCPFPRAVKATVRWSADRSDLDRNAFFGSKLQALEWLDENVIGLYKGCMLASSDTERMDQFMRIPGIGVAKAGFLCQLIFGTVGCLDSHNLERFGFSEKSFRSVKTCSYSKRIERINAYIAACKGCGSTEWLWDSWCEHVSTVRKYDTADAISALHVTAVCKEAM